MSEYELSVIKKENKELREELKKISERESLLNARTIELNKNINEFNEQLEEFEKVKTLKSQKDTQASLKEKKLKRNLLILSHCIIALGFAYLGVAGHLSSIIADSGLSPGNNILTTGVCRTRDGGNITLAGDQMRVTSVQGGDVRGVVIGEKPIYVICIKKEILFESYSLSSLFFKQTIKQSPNSAVREVETDPIYLMNKKSIMASGICLREDKKKVIYSGRVLEVLNIVETGRERHKVIAVESSTKKQVECDSSELKATILDEEIAKTLVQKELASGQPIEATTLIGKDILITGTCVLENYNSKATKKPLLEFYKRVATVTSEVRENNNIVKITATVSEVPIDEQRTRLDTATVICDKRMFSNVFIEEYKKQ